MNSFYIEGCGEIGLEVSLKSEDARHAAQVMRMKRDDEFCAVDEAGRRFMAEMLEVSKEKCTALLYHELPDNEAAVHITIYQGLPKAEKMELVVQKLTELGADRYVPVKMERCIVKLDEKDGRKRTERLQKIAREAAKQCKRGSCLDVSEPRTWKQLMQLDMAEVQAWKRKLAAQPDDLQMWKEMLNSASWEDLRRHDLILVPWEDASGYGMKAAQAEFPAARNIAIVIGPEGGMSENEVRALEEIGARQVTLGPRILRTETAAIASVAMAMTLWGDIG